MNNYSKMNPFMGGALAQMNFEAQITELQPNYNVVSTFASDYAIADAFGADAVEDTYNRSMQSFKHDIYMLTEMAIVLNWSIWRYFELREEELSIMYDKLWKKLDAYIMDNFEGAELDYYLSVTD